MKISAVNSIKIKSNGISLQKNNFINMSLKEDTFVSPQKNMYPKAVSFKGINAKGKVKQRGILMHITSLPAERSYCGQFLDPQTDQFIDWISRAKQTHWIMNPLNALKEDLCPYSAMGRFSRNKFIVNLNKLVDDEYGNILKTSELPDDITTPLFTLDMLERQKNPRFKIAYERFKNLPDDAKIKKEYAQFEKENSDLWLDQYACYDVISKKYGDDWLQWDKRLQTIPEDARRENLSIIDKTIDVLSECTPFVLRDEIGLYKFEQFLYDKQYNQTVKQLNQKGIHLILDLPIGVSANGVDTWGRKNIFLLNKDFKPDKVSGCPSEGAYHYTQVWNHALYDYDSPDFWDYQEATLKQILKTADLRLDHFVGYINRAEIPTKYTKPDGTVLVGEDIFKPTDKGGMGVDFFLPEWIANINDKKSPKGENVFELFIRVAKECGKKPEDAYILENFGPLAKTKAYKEFDKKYGKQFMSQKVPIGMGIADKSKISSPYDIDKTPNIALLTGNHDMPSLREYIDNLMGVSQTRKFSPKIKKLFKEFCVKELKLNEEEMQNPEEVFKNAMKWYYTKNVQQVQTTLQDALGLYWRPNLPGYWNGHEDKYLMKPSPVGQLPIWSRVFPKDFLTRENHSGINAGYRNRAQAFVDTMQKLFADTDK